MVAKGYGRARDAVVHRVGRRGSALLFFFMLDMVYAYSLYRPAPEAEQQASVRYIADIAPLWVWATAWLFVGLLCGFYAFRVKDNVGFAAAAAIKVMWGVLYVGAAFVGVERAYVSAAIWLCLAAWIGIIASWPEPPVPTFPSVTPRSAPPPEPRPPEFPAGRGTE